MRHPLTYITVLIALLLPLIGGGGTASAQDFNPSNPPEPQTLSKLTVTSTPAGVALASGTGRYVKGRQVYVNTSAVDTDYAFKRWEKDGKTVSTSRGFYYTTDGTDETLTAVYEYVIFNPDSPAEPSEVYKWRLYLACEPEEACSFNLDNEERFRAGEAFSLTAYPSQGFVFDGWFEGSEKVSDSLTMPCTMPASNRSLTARFTFLPDSPDEPMGGGQQNVDNRVNYDVNGDGVVNAVDATTIISHSLSEKGYLKKYDVNGDGVVNVVDATVIISHFLAQ